MRNVLQCIAVGLSLSIGLAAAQAPSTAGQAPGFWFREGVQPPPLAPVRDVPATIRKLEPITDPSRPGVFGRNLFAVVGSVPTEGLCLSVGLPLMVFEGDPDFFDPFLLWLPYTVGSSAVYDRWGSLSNSAQAANDPYEEGPVKRWNDTMSGRSLRFASPQDLFARNRTEASVEIIEARFARRETLEAYMDAQPWPRDGHVVLAEACSDTPISPAGGHSSLAEAYLFVRVAVFLPYMANVRQLPPEKRELWRQHQNELMLHEFVHLEGLMRILAESAAQLRAQAEHDRIKHEAYIASLLEIRDDSTPMFLAGAKRRKPLDAGDPQLSQYLEFIKRRFDEHAMSYHAFLGDEKDGTSAGPSRRRHDGSGDLPPYWDEARARVRLQREFDSHWQKVRAIYPDLPETPPQ